VVNKDQIERGLAAYLDAEFMPKVHTDSLRQFAIGTAASVAVKRAGVAVEALKTNKALNALGVIDSDGMVDIELLAEEAKKNIPPDGVKVPIPMIGDITIRQTDVDLLYRCINGISTCQ